LTVSGEKLRIPIDLVDIHQLKSNSPEILSITPLKDEPPSIYLESKVSSYVIENGKTVDFNLIGGDDFGIHSAGYAIFKSSTTLETPVESSIIKEHLLLNDSNNPALNEEVAFNSSLYELPPQAIQVRGWVKDRNPANPREFSEAITIHILSAEDYASYLLQRYKNTINKIEDISQREEENKDRANRVEKLLEDAAKLEKEGKLDAANQLKELANDEIQEIKDSESANQEATKKATQEIEDILSDAAKSTSMDKQSIKDMMDTLDNMRSAEKNMSDASQSMDSASQANDTEQQKSDTKKAQEAQEKAIEDLKKAATKAKKSSDRMEEETFVNRLKQAARNSDAVAQTYIDLIKQEDESPRFTPLGIEYEKALDRQKSELQDNFVRQHKLQVELRWIEEDIISYYERTKKPEHQELIDTMKKMEIDQGMEIIKQGMKQNHSSLTVLDSKKWAETLRGWAQKLSQSGSQQGGGGGGGGNSGQLDDDDFEFMLRVMRIISCATSILPLCADIDAKLKEQKIDTPVKIETAKIDHTKSSYNLSIDQDELNADLQELIDSQTNEQVILFLKQAEALMAEVTDNLEENDTTNKTIGAETEVIEKIYEAAKQKSQESSGSKESKENMGKMLEDFKNGGKFKPNSGKGEGEEAGNASPERDGTSDADTERTTTTQSNDATHERRLQKQTGPSGANLPSEYNKALEAYRNNK